MIVRTRKRPRFNAFPLFLAFLVLSLGSLWLIRPDVDEPTENDPSTVRKEKENNVDLALYKDDMSKQISRTNKLVYIHIPKTGGSTVEESSLFDDHRNATGRRAGGHYRISHVMDDIHAHHLEGFVTATTIRDPVDRFVSAFYYSKHGPPSDPNHGYYQTVQRLMGDVDNVTDLVRKLDASPGHWRSAKRSYIHLVPMVYWVVYEGRGEFGIDVVMCQEMWVDGIQRLLRAIQAFDDMPRGIMQHKRNYGDKQEKEHLDNSTRASILQNYALDACLFGYSDRYNPPTNNKERCIGSLFTRQDFTKRLKWCKDQIRQSQKDSS